jgi:hypothetical protein
MEDEGAEEDEDEDEVAEKSAETVNAPFWSSSRINDICRAR